MSPSEHADVEGEVATMLVESSERSVIVEGLLVLKRVELRGVTNRMRGPRD